jgi:hypothetical protein
MNTKKEKRFVIVIFGMLAVLIIAVFVGAYISHIQTPAHTRINSINTHEGNRSQFINYTTYTNANFTIDYPADWTVIPTASTILFVSKNRYAGGYITLDLQLLSSIESGGIYNSVDYVVADLLQRFPGGKKNVSNISINYERGEMLSGAKGKEVSISYTFHNISYTQTQIIARKGKYFYVLAYHAPAAYYAEQEEVYEYAKKHWNWK